MTAQAALAHRPHSSAASVVTTRCITTLPALERELGDGLLMAWRQLIEGDAFASCFQSPGWCLPWYRAYHDEFDPFVVVVRSGSSLAGIVPLAVRRASGELAFASGTMADYRDIVAADGFRATVVEQLLRVYLEGRFPNPLQIGWIDPSSNTPALVAEACRAHDVRFSAWQQPCYRWVPTEGENLTRKFSRVRTHLNYFKRMGEVTFDVITQADEWAAFRAAFFQQHSLRQLQADRTVSFDDPRKRRFYDRLFDSPAFQTHITALRLDGTLLSGHVGIVWRDVLMLGAPSISIEHEQRSPALILLSWVMQNAASLGLKGFDLTVGNTEFKKRLGNHCVNVTMMELYGRRRAYYARGLRARAVAVAKGVVAAVAGEDAWKTRVLPAADAVRRQVTLARESGVVSMLRSRKVTQGAGPPRVIDLTPEALRSLESSAAGLAWQVHENRIEDLLRWTGSSAATNRAIRECARSYAKQRAGGAMLQTLITGEKLAGWCLMSIGESSDEAVLTGLHTTPEYRERGAEQALLAAVGRGAAGRGATRMVVTD